jgi:predicted PurR-regulated permease PerM
MPGRRNGVLGGLFAIVLVFALKQAASLLVPVVVAFLFGALLLLPTRWLAAKGMPFGWSAAITVFGAWLLVLALLGALVMPARDLVASAPAAAERLQSRLHDLVRPLQALQRTAERVEAAATGSEAGKGTPTVKVAQKSLLQRFTGSTLNAIGAALTVVFLSYFLVASAPRLRRKLASIAGRQRHEQVEAALEEMGQQMSTYLVYSTLVGLGVGLLTFGLLTIVGVPNALLWGTVAAALNYVPYIGAFITLALVTAAALVTFDTLGPVLTVAGGFFAINLLEGNLVTPMLLGRKMPLNPVSIFVGLLFWGWLWGVVGALLAVPLTVMVKIICDHVTGLKPVGTLLDS